MKFKLKKLKSKYFSRIIFILSFLLFTVIPTIISFADDSDIGNPEINHQIKEATPEITKLLIKFSEYLNFNGVVQDVLQYLKYIILRGLYFLADAGYKAYKAIFELNTYFDSEKVNFIYKTALPITLGILFLSFVYIGYRMLLQKKDDRVGFVSNLILACCLILILPTALISLNTVSKLGFDMINTFNAGGRSKQETYELNKKIKTDTNQELATEVSPVDNIYKTLFIDMQKINDEKFKKDIDLINPNNLTVAELNRIDPTRLIKEKNEILNYKLNGNKAEEVGYTVFGNPGYYSWSILFWRGVAYLLIITYVYILVGIKQAGVIFNLAVLKIISPLVLSSDLHSGERTKAVIKEVLHSYVMLVGMHFLVTLFSFYLIWISSLEIAFYKKLMMLVGGSIAVVGAGIYERILGISGVGARFSPLQTMYQMKMLSSGMFRGIKNNSIVRGTKGVSNKIFKNTFSKNSPYFNKENSKGNSGKSMNDRAGDNLRNNNLNSNSKNRNNNSSGYRQNLKKASTTKNTKTSSNKETRSSMFTKINTTQRNDNLRRK